MNNNNKYLNEEEYQKNNKKVKKIGKILLIVGIITLVISILLIVLGIIGFSNTTVNGIESFEIASRSMKKTAGGIFGSFGLFAVSGFINTIGFILTVAGGITMFIAHRREITAYTIQQTMPIAQEGIEKMTPTVANAAGSIAKAIKNGMRDSKDK